MHQNPDHLKNHRHTGPTDEQLMKRISRGDEAAFTVLYERYAGKLLILINRQLGDDAKAKDLLHDIFLQLIEKPEQFDTNHRFSPWIYSVALNRCRNERRNKQNRDRLLREQTYERETAAPEIISNLHRREFREAYEQLYLQLKEDQQLLLTLRFNQELPVKEIAQIMGIAEGTVKSRLFYLMQFFAEKLKTHHPAK